MAARVREVIWAESARDALDSVIGYIAQDSPQTALQVLDDALRAGASLAMFAERGRVVPELNDRAIRELFVYKYRLQYEVGGRARADCGISSRRAGLRHSAGEPESGVVGHAPQTREAPQSAIWLQALQALEGQRISNRTNRRGEVQRPPASHGRARRPTRLRSLTPRVNARQRRLTS
jgi:toxin ParE1/3/4